MSLLREKISRKENFETPMFFVLFLSQINNRRNFLRSKSFHVLQSKGRLTNQLLQIFRIIYVKMVVKNIPFILPSTTRRWANKNTLLIYDDHTVGISITKGAYAFRKRTCTYLAFKNVINMHNVILWRPH